MSVEQFWHEDPKLFEVYEKAYYRNLSYTAWLNGKYIFMSVQLGVSNCLVDKESKMQDYIDYKDPFPQKEDKVTKDNVEEKHRNLMVQEAEWLNKLLNGEKGAN